MFPDLYIKPSRQFGKVTTSRLRPKSIFYKDTITTLYYSSPIFKEYMRKNPENAIIGGSLFNFVRPDIKRLYSSSSNPKDILTIRESSNNQIPVIMSPATVFTGSGIYIFSEQLGLQYIRA